MGSKNRKPALVSVIIATYNRAHIILQSIESVLKQTFKDYEIVVVDDGSSDHTEQLLRDRYAGIGQYVTAGTPVGRVFSIDTVEVRLPLTDSQLVELNLPLGFMAGHISEPPVVAFTAGMGNREYRWRGHIVRVDAAVDPRTRLIYATAEVTDPYGLAATDGMPLAVGMFVSAEIESVAERVAYVMPRLALRNQDKVYVINADNRLEIRTVTVLSTSEERVLVAGGVVPGERVVTSTLPNAVDGMEVEPVERRAQS